MSWLIQGLWIIMGRELGRVFQNGNRGAQWLMSPGRAVEGRIGREPYQKIIASMSPDRAAAKTHFTKENFHHNPYRIVLINQGILL